VDLASGDYRGRAKKIIVVKLLSAGNIYLDGLLACVC
jgi:hypothetical protein